MAKWVVFCFYYFDPRNSTVVVTEWFQVVPAHGRWTVLYMGVETRKRKEVVPET